MAVNEDRTHNKDRPHLALKARAAISARDSLLQVGANLQQLAQPVSVRQVPELELPH